MRVDLRALFLSLAILAGAAAFALRDFPLPLIAGAGQGVVEGGLRRGTEIVACRLDRPATNSGVAFGPPCAGQALSPDGRYLVVRNAGQRNGVGLVRARDGVSLSDLGVLDDGAAFTIRWSNRSSWFFANQVLASGGEQIRLFEVAREAAIERTALVEEARRVLLMRHPCLAGADIRVSGDQWNVAGTRVALMAEGRADRCQGQDGGLIRRLSMVGDVTSGSVDPRSVRGFVPDLPVFPL